MGKKKSEDDAPLDNLTDRIWLDIEKEYGKDIMVSGDDIVSRPRVVVPISPSLDIITSGGIEEGSWVGITGPPKTGKTTLALDIASICQRPEYGARPVFYLKAEGRLSTTHLKGIRGLNRSKGSFMVVESKEGRILSSQDYLRIGSNILRTVPGAVLIIDSASALCDETELNGGVGTILVGGGNKAFAQFCRTMNQVVPVNRSIVLVITHLQARIGPGVPGMSERVAKAAQYQYDYMLRTISKTPWKAGDRIIGLEITWQCNTSKLGPPGMKINSFLRFGVGVDRLYECISLGMSAGLITGKGWYTLSFLAKPEYAALLNGEAPPKAQGAEKVYALLSERPELAHALEKEVASMASSLAGSAGDE